jgi:hypothetical protein
VKWLVRLYPRAWRLRYGRELADLLAESEHPWRDSLNVALHAVLAWTEVTVFKAMNLIVAACSLVLFGFTIGQLDGGVREIPQHWWSSISAAVALVAVTGTIVSLTRTGNVHRS